MQNYLNDLSKGLMTHVLDLGEAMLKCGAEVSRVEDTLQRIFKSYGAADVDVLTITSCIILTVTVSDSGVITAEDLEVMSDDETVATAVISGTEVTVTGVKGGTATIYVVAEGSKSAHVAVTVTDSNPEPIPPEEETTPNDPAEPDNNTGLWIGIGCAAAVVVAAAAVAIVLVVRKKNKAGKGENNNNSDNNDNTNS